MEKDQTELLIQSLETTNQCLATLVALSKTCCMPERSPHMRETEEILKVLLIAINRSFSDIGQVDKCIEEIARCGTKLGYLYATCCTPTREVMYQDMFRKLGTVHMAMWQLLGHSH